MLKCLSFVPSMRGFCEKTLFLEGGMEVIWCLSKAWTTQISCFIQFHYLKIIPSHSSQMIFLQMNSFPHKLVGCLQCYGNREEKLPPQADEDWVEKWDK